MSEEIPKSSLSVMLIVSDAVSAVEWYKRALGANLVWDLGGVAGLHLRGAPFFLHEAVPGRTSEPSPDEVGMTTTRIEVFVDDPGALIERASEPLTWSRSPSMTLRGGFTNKEASPIRTAIVGRSATGRPSFRSPDRQAPGDGASLRWELGGTSIPGLETSEFSRRPDPIQGSSRVGSSLAPRARRSLPPIPPTTARDRVGDAAIAPVGCAGRSGLPARCEWAPALARQDFPLSAHPGSPRFRPEICWTSRQGAPAGFSGGRSVRRRSHRSWWFGGSRLESWATASDWAEC